MAGMQRPDGFWDNLERVVSAKVESALRDRGARREPVIEYLRHLEEMVRSECDRRQTVQIIASGRSLLGDRAPVASRRGHLERWAPFVTVALPTRRYLVRPAVSCSPLPSPTAEPRGEGSLRYKKAADNDINRTYANFDRRDMCQRRSIEAYRLPMGLRCLSFHS
jgi:hypothetical protein